MEITQVIGFNILIFLISYLFGSINTSIIYSKYFLKKDIRFEGSGNAGATNISRISGLMIGFTVWIIDFMKVIALVIIFYFLRKNKVYGFEYAFVQLAALGCLFGHVWPIYFKFKGGKGVSTMFGFILAFNWILAIAVIVIFWISIYLFDKVSAASILSLTICGALTFVPWFINHFNIFMYMNGELGFTNPWFTGVTSIVFGMVIIIKHIQNIRRVINKSESSFRVSTLKREPGCKLFIKKHP